MIGQNGRTLLDENGYLCVGYVSDKNKIIEMNILLEEWKFSCIKRTFGEYVNSRKFHNMTKELIIKTSLYNTFVAMSM
jgi:hypothetical protein